MKTGERNRLRQLMELNARRGISLRFATYDEVEYVLTGVGDFPAAATPADVVAKRA